MRNELYYQQKETIAQVKKAKNSLKNMVIDGQARNASKETIKKANQAAFQLEVISRNKLMSPHYSLVPHVGSNRRQRRQRLK